MAELSSSERPKLNEDTAIAKPRTENINFEKVYDLNIKVNLLRKEILSSFIFALSLVHRAMVVIYLYQV